MLRKFPTYFQNGGWTSRLNISNIVAKNDEHIILWIPTEALPIFNPSDRLPVTGRLIGGWMQGERCWYRNIGFCVMRNLLEKKVIIPMNHFKRTEMLLTLPEVYEDSLKKWWRQMYGTSKPIDLFCLQVFEVEQQRKRLPIYKHRLAILHAAPWPLPMKIVASARGRFSCWGRDPPCSGLMRGNRPGVFVNRTKKR